MYYNYVIFLLVHRMIVESKYVCYVALKDCADVDGR
jgi:hypothetical protein